MNTPPHRVILDDSRKMAKIADGSVAFDCYFAALLVTQGLR